MLLLARTSLRTRWRAYVGVFLTVAAAVTLVSACGILLEAGIRANVTPERLAGAPLVVAGDQTVQERSGSGEDAYTVTAGVQERVRIDADLVSAVSSVDGVRTARPEISFPAYLQGPDGTSVTGPDGSPSWGHGWESASVTGFALVAGHAPRSPGEVVVDRALSRRAGVAVGDHVTVTAGGRPVAGSVVGVATRGGGPLTQQAAVFFTAAEATRLYAHPGQVDAIGVLVAPGASVDQVASAVRAAAGSHVEVLTGDGRGTAEFLDGVDAGVRLIAISGSLGGIGLAVTIFVVAGMLSLVVRQRQREVALLRAIAATPRQVRRLIAIETLLVTLPAALAGVWPGIWLSTVLFAGLQDHGVLPASFRHEVGPLPVLVAVASTLLVVQLSAYLAGRRAARVRPTEALASAALEPARIGLVRALVGLLALSGTVALFVVSLHLSAAVAPAVAPGMVALLMLDVALFAPLLAAGGVRLLSLPARWSDVGGYLAHLNTRAYARRLAAAMTPIVLTVGIAGMTVFQQTTLSDEAARQGEQRMLADRVVAGGDAGLPVDSVHVLSGEPGVAAVVGLLTTTVRATSEIDMYPAQAVTSADLRDVLDLDVRHGSLSRLRSNQVALSEDLAGKLRVSIGDKAELRLGDGTAVQPTVVATYGRSRGFADAVLPMGDVLGHVTDPLLSTVLVRSDGTTGSVDATLSAFRDRHPSARVGDASMVRQAEDANAATQAWVSFVLLGLVIVFVSLAVVNTLVLATADRVREFALLRLIGTTKRQVLRMMRWEALIVVTLGGLLGTVVAAATLAPFSKSTTGSLTPSTPLWYCVAIFGSAAFVGLVSMLVPTRLAMRARPIDAIGARE